MIDPVCAVGDAQGVARSGGDSADAQAATRSAVKLSPPYLCKWQVASSSPLAGTRHFKLLPAGSELVQGGCQAGDGVVRMVEFVQAEQSKSESSEISGFVTLQWYASGALQTLGKELLA